MYEVDVLIDWVKWVCLLKTLVRVGGVGGVQISVHVGSLMMRCSVLAINELCHGMVGVYVS